MSCAPPSDGTPLLSGKCWYNWHGHVIVGFGTGTSDQCDAFARDKMSAMLSLGFSEITEADTPPDGNYGFRIWVAEVDGSNNVTGYHEWGDDPGDDAAMLPWYVGTLAAPTTLADDYWSNECTASPTPGEAPFVKVARNFGRAGEIECSCDGSVLLGGLSY